MKDRNDCTFTGVDAYTEGKGRYAPERKEEDTIEAWKDSKEFQEKVKPYEGPIQWYNGRLWLG
jgi:hypothetical protein